MVLSWRETGQPEEAGGVMRIARTEWVKEKVKNVEMVAGDVEEHKRQATPCQMHVMAYFL